MWCLAGGEKLLFHRDCTKVVEMTVLHGGVVSQGGQGLVLELDFFLPFFGLFSLKGKITEHIEVDLLLDVVDGEHLLVLVEGGAVRGGWEVWGGGDPGGGGPGVGGRGGWDGGGGEGGGGRTG